MKEPERKLDELAHTVIGAAIKVHRILGPGYLESVYEEALFAELYARNVQFERQKQFDVLCRGKKVGASHSSLTHPTEHEAIQ